MTVRAFLSWSLLRGRKETNLRTSLRPNNIVSYAAGFLKHSGCTYNVADLGHYYVG